MTFISYAQNYEDVLLWRALQDIENGFYIDVGAAWPEKDSVTRAFYSRGWHGINVEPNPKHYLSLKQHRPRDINLQLAVSEVEGVLTMNLVGETGLSTLDSDIAGTHQYGGWEVAKELVNVTTLTNICQQYLPKKQAIHFLKVDVEGFEGNVLRSNSWLEYRPWIVLVEATFPMTNIESHESWESILLNAGYVFKYADGLNRFYVANERPELFGAFKYPPNVFDNFIKSAHQEAETKAQEAETKAQEAETKAQEAETKAQEAEAKAQEAEAKAQEAEVVLSKIYASKLWRITSPLRLLINFAKKQYFL